MDHVKQISLLTDRGGAKKFKVGRACLGCLHKLNKKQHFLSFCLYSKNMSRDFLAQIFVKKVLIP